MCFKMSPDNWCNADSTLQYSIIDSARWNVGVICCIYSIYLQTYTSYVAWCITTWTKCDCLCRMFLNKTSFTLFQIKMLQGSSILGHERPLVIRVSFSTCVVGTVCLPLLGLITCVFISSVFHYEDSTGTHCQVMSLFCKPIQACFFFSLNANDILNHPCVFPGA